MILSKNAFTGYTFEHSWGDGVAGNVLTKTIAWIVGTVAGPIMSFFKKNGFNIALAILAFIFLFKIGEAFLGRMSVIFYKEIGFTKSDIALYSKGLGWITTVVFTLLGGLFAIRSGVIKAMFVSGILMASTNLLFSLLAWSGKSELLFAMVIVMHLLCFSSYYLKNTVVKSRPIQYFLLLVTNWSPYYYYY